MQSSEFDSTRGHIVREMVNIILNVDPDEEGTTILLRSYEGGGTSEILKRVRKATHKKGGRNHVVVRIDLSARSYQSTPQQFLRDLVHEMGMQLTAKASYEVRRNIRSIYDKYKKKYEQFKPEKRKVVTRSKLSPGTLLDLAGTSFRVAIGLGIGRETETTDDLIAVDLPDAENLVEDIVTDLCELAGYISREKGKLVLMLNKVTHLDTLSRLERLAKHSGVVIITVVDKDQYDQWVTQNNALVRRFAQRGMYVNCLWDLPQGICEGLFHSAREVDTDEFRVFFHYLHYYGRGIPNRIIDGVFKSQIGTRGEPRTLGNLFGLNRESLFVPVSKLKEWHKYAKIESLLQQGGWTRMFSDKDDPTCCLLEGYDEEMKDQIKQGVYGVLDKLVKYSQSGAAVTIDDIGKYAATECHFPFAEDTTYRVVRDLIDYLHDSGMIGVSLDTLDLSRITRPI